MKLYYSNPETRIFTQVIDLNIKSNSNIPDYVSTNPIPENIPADKLAFLNPDKTWKLIDNPNFIKVYNHNNQDILIVDKNNIPDGYTALKPDSSEQIFYNGKWDIESNIINSLKELAISKINTDVRNKIESGYISSVLGTEHTYDSSLTDQFEIDYLSRQNMDFEIKCVPPGGSKKRILHTAEQIKSLANEFMLAVSEIKRLGDLEKTNIRENDYTIEELEIMLKNE